MSKWSHFSKGFHCIMMLKIFLVKDMVNCYYLVSHRIVWGNIYLNKLYTELRDASCETF